jgi:diguanylate cyclase (GGDEF)-like protein
MFLGPTMLPAGLRATGSPDPWHILVRLSEVLTAETGEDAMISGVLAVLAELAEIEACWVARPGRDGYLGVVAAVGQFAREHEDIVSLVNVVHGEYSGGPSGRAWRSGKPEIIDDWRTDPSVAIWQPGTAHLNYHSAAAVPLRGRAGHHSLLVMYSNRKKFFSEVWNTDFLAHLAVLIGNGLENREKHAALQRAQRLYQTLFNGADMLLTARSEQTVLKRLCKAIVDSGLFVSAGVGTVSAGGMHKFVAAAARRHGRALRMATFQMEKDQPVRPLTIEAWLGDKTMIDNDYFSSQRPEDSRHRARLLGFRSMAALIIRRGGARWAVMGVSAAEQNYFDETLIHLLERMAGMVGHMLDELDLKAALRAERETQSRIARQDALTLLPNRLAFQEQLEGAMARAVRHGTNAGIAMIDLDDFKQINDQWGHAAGDHVLKLAGARIRGMLREVDFIARLGGDEFALILEDWAAAPENWRADISRFCGRLHEAMSEPVVLPNGKPIFLRLSAGFTLYPLDQDTQAQLVRHADIALYEAKATKGASGQFWRLYSDSLPARGEPFRARALLREGALEVHFQPILNLETGAISAIEALARLRAGGLRAGGPRENGKLLAPRDFLPELTVDDRCLLFRQVLTAGLNQLLTLDPLGLNLNLAVNLDSEVLLLAKTVPFIKKMLLTTGIHPPRLVLEILETHEFLDLGRTVSQIRAVRALGVRVALDDVGAGYASILKIRELPLDAVKLDRGFVAGLREKPDDLLFISIIQTLTASLGIILIVEGVEDEDVLDALRMVGVRRVQGFVIAEPMAGAALADWLANYRPRPASTTPKTLLGAYALHSNWIRIFEFWRLHAPVLEYLQTNNPFSLDDFFSGQGGRHTAARDAYATLQALLRHGAADRALVQEAAGHFRGKLIAALQAEG